jgi:hypothetical protein
VKSVIYVVQLHKTLECYLCSELRIVLVIVKLKIIIINFNSAWRISNKSSYQIQNSQFICRVTKQTRDNILLT